MNRFIILVLCWLFFPFIVFPQSEQVHLVSEKILSDSVDNMGILLLGNGENFTVFTDRVLSDTNMDMGMHRILSDTVNLFSRYFGGTGQEQIKDVITLPDGYLMAGVSASTDGDFSGNHGNADALLIRCDTMGNIIWLENYGGSAYDDAVSLMETGDGTFIVAGSTRSQDGDIEENHGQKDVWIFTVDEAGNLLHSKTFGGSETDFAAQIRILDDTLYAVLATSKSDDGDIHHHYGSSDYWLFLYDPEGDSIVWERSYGGEDSDAACGFVLADGDFVLAGSSRTSGINNFNNGKNDYRIISLNSNGNVKWDNTFGGSFDDVARGIVRADGGGFLVSGYTYSNDGDVEGNHGGTDMWVIKVSNDGKLLWQRPLGGTFYDAGNRAVVCNDGGFRITGFASSRNGDVEGWDGTGKDVWTVKICEDHLIKEFVNICEGEIYTWEGETYSETGVYEKRFVNRCGFDSIRQLKLVVNPYPEDFTIEGNTEVYIYKPAIYTAPLNYSLTYHWFPENGMVVDTPAFNQIRIAWGTGGFGLLKAVAENAGNCTSDTAFLEVIVFGEGVEDLLPDHYVVYPNPADDDIFVKGEPMDEIALFALNGKKLRTKSKGFNDTMSLDVSDLKSGVYLLKILSAKGFLFKRIVVF